MVRKLTVASLFEDVVAAEDVLRERCIRVVAALPVDDPNMWHLTVTHALKAGLAPRDLAREFGCAASTIGRWADGSNAPSLAARQWTRNRLCELLGCEPIELEIEEPTKVPEAAE